MTSFRNMYRVITQRESEYIGMAASVAGGYVAVSHDAPSIEHYTAAACAERRRVERSDAVPAEWRDELLDELYPCNGGRKGHRESLAVSGGVWLAGNRGGPGYVMYAPEGHPLREYGIALPDSLVADVEAVLAAAGYAVQVAVQA